MRVFLASPNSQMQAHAANGMDVLLSYALYPKWMNSWVRSFRSILIDSGAYSELTGNAKVDVVAYAEWAQTQDCVAWAGLDDIRGDWRRSLANYAHGGFPTIHDTDPPGLLDDLIPLARARRGWIGVGLKPPRHGKEFWVRSTLDRIPDDLHVHGWALRRYTRCARLDSVDSTNWFRDAQKILTHHNTRHLTPGEALDIVVKRYQRWEREVVDPHPSLLEAS